MFGHIIDVASEGIEHTIENSTPKVLNTKFGGTVSKIGGKANVVTATAGGFVDGYNEFEGSLANEDATDVAIINGTVECGFSIGTSLAAGALGAKLGAIAGSFFQG